MRFVSFEDKEKAVLFDRIADCFFKQNFGSASKSDIELLMFDIYMKKMMEENVDSDGIVQYEKCSDYLISKELGITQQRVRNLKIKDQLVYPVDYKWEKTIVKLFKNARVDENNKVTINIPDPNLYIEIQNFLESSGGYVEKQLNSKLLVIRVEYLVELMIACDEDENSRKNIIRQIEKAFKEQRKSEIKFDEKNIGRTLINGALNLTTLLANISSIVNPGNYVFGILKNIFNIR